MRSYREERVSPGRQTSSNSRHREELLAKRFPLSGGERGLQDLQKAGLLRWIKMDERRASSGIMGWSSSGESPPPSKESIDPCSGWQSGLILKKNCR